MIPKKIYFTWKTKNLDGNRLIWFNSWRKLNPDYELIIMDDNDIDNYIQNNFPVIYDIFRLIPIGAMRADIWRYCIIYKEGGMYTDIDTECFVPINQWNISNEYEMIISSGSEGDMNFCQFTFASIPNHPVFKCIIDLCFERLKSLNNINNIRPDDLFYCTGPTVFTDGICKYYELDIKNKSNRIKYIYNNKLLPKSIYIGLNIFNGKYLQNNGGSIELSNDICGWNLETGLLSNGFDWKFYINYYQDLKNTGIDTKEKAYNHYYNYGYKEKRIVNDKNKQLIPENFDLIFYINYYEDLKNIVITRQYNYEIFALYHYLNYGITENRIYSLESIIHKLLIVYNPNKSKKRYGSNGDGGYVLIEEIGNYDYFISCGIGNNIDFEIDILTNHNQLYGIAFDGTINDLPKNIERLEFIKKNINQENNLYDILNKYQNVLLKMDIEGYEIEWINLCSIEYLKNIKQLIIEIHGIELNKSFNSDFSQKIKALEKLNNVFTLVHIHGNNYSHLYNHTNIPTVLECTYVRSDIIPKMNKNTQLLPSEYDMPNCPLKPDYNLNFEPFVFNS